MILLLTLTSIRGVQVSVLNIQTQAGFPHTVTWPTKPT